MPLVMLQVTLLQSGQTILTTFTGKLQNRALETFRKTGVNVRLGVRVTEITESEVPVSLHSAVALMQAVPASCHAC